MEDIQIYPCDKRVFRIWHSGSFLFPSDVVKRQDSRLNFGAQMWTRLGGGRRDFSLDLLKHFITKSRTTQEERIVRQAAPGHVRGSLNATLATLPN